MKKKVLIVEDNLTQLEVLRQLVMEVNANAVIYTASDAATAYKTLMEKTIDIFMVDIILDTTKSGDIGGIKLVNAIRGITKYLFTPVIFITSLEDAAGYAYKDLNCLGYVEKPFEPDQVKKLVAKAMHFSTEKDKEHTVCFRKDGIIYPVREQDIVYLQNRNRYMNVYLEDGEILKIPYMSCKQILEDADSNQLIQCNRNTIVNRKYISNMDYVNRYITLKNERGKLEIGISYRKRVEQEFES